MKTNFNLLKHHLDEMKLTLQNYFPFSLLLGWRCKRYGHRTGDKECPFFIKGNQKLEQFRVVSKTCSVTLTLSETGISMRQGVTSEMNVL
jgi:hypothetical protein